MNQDYSDILAILERNWNIRIPGFNSEEIRQTRRIPPTEAHKQRLAHMKKAAQLPASTATAAAKRG